MLLIYVFLESLNGVLRCCYSFYFLVWVSFLLVRNKVWFDHITDVSKSIYVSIFCWCLFMIGCDTTCASVSERRISWWCLSKTTKKNRLCGEGVIKGGLFTKGCLYGYFALIKHLSWLYLSLTMYGERFYFRLSPCIYRGLWGLWLWPTRYKLVPYMRLGWLCQTRFKLTTCLLEKKRKKHTDLINILLLQCFCRYPLLSF